MVQLIAKLFPISENSKIFQRNFLKSFRCNYKWYFCETDEGFSKQVAGGIPAEVAVWISKVITKGSLKTTVEEIPKNKYEIISWNCRICE